MEMNAKTLKRIDNNTEKVRAVVNKALSRSKTSSDYEQTKTVAVVLEALSEFTNFKEDEYNLLVELLSNNEEKAVNFLQQIGVSMNNVDENGNTMIHLALKGRNFETANRLIAATKVINVTNNDMQSYLMLALENSIEIINDVKKENEEACKFIKTLFDRNAEYNKQDKLGNTELFYAAKAGNLKAVENLIKLGLDPKHKNLGKMTASTVAAIKEHSMVALFLDELTNEASAKDADVSKESLIIDRAYSAEALPQVNSVDGRKLLDLYIQGDLTAEEYKEVYADFLIAGKIDFDVVKEIQEGYTKPTDKQYKNTSNKLNQMLKDGELTEDEFKREHNRLDRMVRLTTDEEIEVYEKMDLNK